MEIAINHLTRMKSPYVCVAGVDRSGAHKRPVLAYEQLHRLLLGAEGGPFSLGTVLDLGSTTARPAPPEVEDAEFEWEGVRPVRTLDREGFLRVLSFVAKPNLREIFGLDLDSLSATAAAVPEGKGRGSLGVLEMAGEVELTTRNRFGKHEITFSFRDADLGFMSLKVTDIRLWKADHVTPSFRDIRALRSRLDGCYIAVGLTRALPVSSYQGVWHWLQVNNVFPMDDPLWDRV